MGTENCELIKENLEEVDQESKYSFFKFILKDFTELFSNISNRKNTLTTLIFISTFISTSLFLGICLLGVYIFTIWSLVVYGYTSTLIMFILETIVFSPFILLPITYFLVKLYQWFF